MTSEDKKELLYILEGYQKTVIDPLMANNYLHAQKTLCTVLKTMLEKCSSVDQQILFLDTMIKTYDEEMEKLKNDKE